MEGNAGIEQILQCTLAFAAFFIGIVIRKYTFPGEHSPSLGRQLLLGVPMSLIIVCPLLLSFVEISPITQGTGTQRVIHILMTYGVIMEHGMFLMERATRFVVKAKKEPAPAVP